MRFRYKILLFILLAIIVALVIRFAIFPEQITVIDLPAIKQDPIVMP